MQTIISKLQIRNDSSEHWEDANPILMSGELGYDTTRKNIKIGDGISQWKDLPALPTDNDINKVKSDVETLFAISDDNNQFVKVETTDNYSSRVIAQNVIDGSNSILKKVEGITIKNKNLINILDHEEELKNQTYNDTATGFTPKKGKTYTLSFGYRILKKPSESDESYILCGIGYGVASYTTDFTEQHPSDPTKTIDIGHMPYPRQIVNDPYVFTKTFKVPDDFDETNKLFIRFAIRPQGVTTSPYTVRIQNIQLEEGATATSYTPYFDGLKNAQFKGLTTCGKNLIKYPYPFSGKITRNGITFEEENGIITASGTATSQARCTIYEGVLGAGDYTISERMIVETLSDRQKRYLTGHFTLNFDTKVQIYINIVQGTEVDNLVICPQLERGSTATDYEPYIENKIEFDEPIDCGLGTTIDFENGKIINRYKTLEFDGNELFWREDLKNEMERHKCYYFELENDSSIFITKHTNLNDAICDRFFYSTYCWTVDEINTWSFETNNRFIYFAVDKNQFPTLQSFKDYLIEQKQNGTPLTIRYITKEVQSETPININNRIKCLKNGFETVENSNDIYGVNPTLTQEYFVEYRGQNDED